MSENPMRNNEQTPFEVLKTQVYPVMNQVILKLIDHIVKSQEVQKHEERLQKKKIIDQLQRKYIERDIEKQEMGSDYEEPDDEHYHHMLGMKKEVVENLVRKKIQRSRGKGNDEGGDPEEEIDANAFNPMKFVIAELKRVYEERGLGK